VYRVLTNSFSPLQNERFEAYRRATFNRQAIRKVCAARAVTRLGHGARFAISPCRQCIDACAWRHITLQVIHQGLGLTVTPQIAQVVGGMAKVFVGEIVERGASEGRVTGRDYGKGEYN